MSQLGRGSQWKPQAAKVVQCGPWKAQPVCCLSICHHGPCTCAAIDSRQVGHLLCLTLVTMRTLPCHRVPLCREGMKPQNDEDDMGMTYEELGVYGRLRKVVRCGPVAMYRHCCQLWRDKYTPQQVADKVSGACFSNMHHQLCRIYCGLMAHAQTQDHLSETIIYRMTTLNALAFSIAACVIIPSTR